MTTDEYRAALKMLGLTPVKPSYDGAILHQGRDGCFYTIPNPETLSDEERDNMIDLYRSMVEG
ncbi:MAG TPA: hypothetical protein VN112_02280 [Ensifer sp.]|nr:hypothetical protein [Ensifer sp.]